MDAEQQAEFADLRARAESALRRGAQPSRRRHRAERIAQVLVMPTFDNWSASEVFRITTGQSEEFLAARTTWDLHADAARLATPVERCKHPRVLTPTLVQQQRPLAPDAANKLAAEIAGLQMFLAPRRNFIGLDGTRYVLTLGDAFDEVSFRWRNNPPEPWVLAGRLAISLVDMVDAVLL